MAEVARTFRSMSQWARELVSASQRVLEADPAEPVEGAVWVVKTGESPTQTVALRVRVDGETVTLAEITR